MNEQMLFRQVIANFGIKVQLLKACEEQAELIRALTRYIFLCDKLATEDAVKDAFQNVLEEIADVEIMLAQLRLIFDSAAFPIDEIRKEKVRRLENLMFLKEFTPEEDPRKDTSEDPEDWSAQLQDS